jgi:hypothetical protein
MEQATIVEVLVEFRQVYQLHGVASGRRPHVMRERCDAKCDEVLLREARVVPD